MAVISCPSCKKKISSKAKSCTYCDVDLTTLDSDKLASIRQEQKIKKSQSLMNQSFIAMLLFCGGFLVVYWKNLQPDTWQFMLASGSTLVGFILYIVTRIRLILLKRSSK